MDKMRTYKAISNRKFREDKRFHLSKEMESLFLNGCRQHIHFCKPCSSGYAKDWSGW